MDRKTEDRIKDALRKAGALGFVEADSDRRGEVVHTGGNYRISWDRLPQDVRIRLRFDQHQDLVRRIGEGQKVELEFSVDNRFFRGPVPLHNVVADIVGTEKPDEYVILGGHLDSWDGAEGAVDNGTGVSTALEAARLLSVAGARPKRTIRFVLWAAEEQGMIGSRAYVRAHPEQLPKISAMFVHDQGTNYLSGLHVTPEMMPQLEQRLEPLTRLDPENKPFELALTDVVRGGGSDHNVFIRVGVPAFSWNQSGRSKYHCMHHTQFDTLATAIDEYQRHSAIVQAVAAYQIANADELLDRSNAFETHRRKIDARHDWAIIEEVPKKGKARDAGLRARDVIVTVDGREVFTSAAVRRYLNQDGPVKKLRIKRGKKTFDVTFDFTKDPGEVEEQERRAARRAQIGEKVFERIRADFAARQKRDGKPAECTDVIEAARARGQK
jgi:hypothetical protein